MPSLKTVGYYTLHPNELRAVIQWLVWHQPVHERDEANESATLKQCYGYLDLTSRSFSAVIKELNPELLVPVCLFYLILRGLDTIEDDMTIPIEKKEPLLRNFHDILEEAGWTFNGNGPNEKDRELLVHFDVVTAEFPKIRQEYRDIIRDITKRMGNGMADYQVNGMVDFRKEKAGGTTGLVTVQDYEIYCHHVAGLVGEGLTRLFVEGKLAHASLLKRPDLHESMGQFLQQTNIIRDVREDFEDSRRFWPKAVWSKYVDKFEDLVKPENREAALKCSSEMILLALERADDCLYYLAGIKDQSVFNFCAIPQSMAIATLELCFRNSDMFDRNVKITRGNACQLMVNSSQNLQLVYGVFREYARRIRKKNDPRDPNFLKISVACGRIEQFTESIFPTQSANHLVTPSALNLSPEDLQKKKEADAESRQDMLFLTISISIVLGIISVFMLFLAWMAGAKLDMIFTLEPVRHFFNNGGFGAPVPSRKASSPHQEL